MNKIICYPIKTDKSVYFEIVVDALRNDDLYSLISLDEALDSPNNINDVKAAFFSFYEDVKCNKKIKMYGKCIQRVFTIQYLKRHNVKIVYTIHNGIPHDHSMIKIGAFMTKYLIKQSDKVIILCDETRNVISEYTSGKFPSDKIVKIPHPNYIGVYNDQVTIDLRSRWRVSNDELVFIFLGLVRPYKNIELIIRLARDFAEYNVKFIIAGAAYDKQYFDELVKMSEGLENIIFTGEFIDNDNIVDYLTAADVMILPYDKSSLNSGPIFIGPSFKKNVITPCIGSAKEFPEKLLYMYNYENEVDHYEKLKKEVFFVIEEFFDNKETFDKRREELYKFVLDYNSPSILKEEYQKLVKKLL